MSYDDLRLTDDCSILSAMMFRKVSSGVYAKESIVNIAVARSITN